jgi:hypothetical protein
MQLGVQSMISNSKNNSYQEKCCGGYSIIPEYGMDIKFKKKPLLLNNNKKMTRV